MKFESQRRQVAAAAREMLEQDLVAGTWGNISVYLADEQVVIITPSGMDYRTMSYEDIVVVDRNGVKLEGKWKPSTESPLHAAIYQARSDIRAIVHTHSVCATAFAAAHRPIPAITEEIAQMIGGAVEVAPYAACGTSDLARGAVLHLGEKFAVLLANHGLVAVGKDLRDAMLAGVIVEKTARIAVMADILGGYQELGDSEISSLRQTFLHKYGQ